MVPGIKARPLPHFRKADFENLLRRPLGIKMTGPPNCTGLMVSAGGGHTDEFPSGTSCRVPPVFSGAEPPLVEVVVEGAEKREID